MHFCCFHNTTRVRDRPVFFLFFFLKSTFVLLAGRATLLWSVDGHYVQLIIKRWCKNDLHQQNIWCSLSKKDILKRMEWSAHFQWRPMKWSCNMTTPSQTQITFYFIQSAAKGPAPTLKLRPKQTLLVWRMRGKQTGTFSKTLWKYSHSFSDYLYSLIGMYFR